MPLGITVKILEIGHFAVAQIPERSAVAVLAEPLADCRLASMAKRRVADIVSETRRLDNRAELVFVHVLGQVFLDQVVDRNGKAAAHAGNFEAVREAAVNVVVHRERVDLSLAAKATECRRENDAVIVAMEIGAVRVRIGRVPVTSRRKKSVPV